MSNPIGTLAKDIVEFDFDNDQTIVNVCSVSGWLDANVGQLNTLLHTSFSGEDALLDLEARAIYRELYLHNFYTKQTRNALRGILNTGNGNSILSLNDGESSVTFVNRNEVSKVYRGLATDTKERLDQLVHQYNMHQSDPRQVGGIEGQFYSGIY